MQVIYHSFSKSWPACHQLQIQSGACWDGRQPSLHPYHDPGQRNTWDQLSQPEHFANTKYWRVADIIMLIPESSMPCVTWWSQTVLRVTLDCMLLFSTLISDGFGLKSLHLKAAWCCQVFLEIFFPNKVTKHTVALWLECTNKRMKGRKDNMSFLINKNEQYKSSIYNNQCFCYFQD